MSTTTQLEKRLLESARYIEKASKKILFPELAVVLGSGFKGILDKVDKKLEIDFRKIPHFPVPNVQGHGSSLVIGKIKNNLVCFLSGRIHMYEGYSAAETVYAVRTLARLKIKGIILTNAAGGLKSSVKPGQVLLIKDHLNLTGQNCLASKEALSLGPVFLDMGSCYDSQWRKILKKKLILAEAKYIGVLGPTYETPAEAALYSSLGGDVIGMSTVQEAIAAHQLGMKVAGLSFVTNMAGASAKNKLTHHEVLSIAKERREILSDIIGKALGALT